MHDFFISYSRESEDHVRAILERLTAARAPVSPLGGWERTVRLWDALERSDPICVLWESSAASPVERRFDPVCREVGEVDVGGNSTTSVVLRARSIFDAGDVHENPAGQANGECRATVLLVVTGSRIVGAGTAAIRAAPRPDESFNSILRPRLVQRAILSLCNAINYNWLARKPNVSSLVRNCDFAVSGGICRYVVRQDFIVPPVSRGLACVGLSAPSFDCGASGGLSRYLSRFSMRMYSGGYLQDGGIVFAFLRHNGVQGALAAGNRCLIKKKKNRQSPARARPDGGGKLLSFRAGRERFRKNDGAVDGVDIQNTNGRRGFWNNLADKIVPFPLQRIKRPKVMNAAAAACEANEVRSGSLLRDITLRNFGRNIELMLAADEAYPDLPELSEPSGKCRK